MSKLLGVLAAPLTEDTWNKLVWSKIPGPSRQFRPNRMLIRHMDGSLEVMSELEFGHKYEPVENKERSEA